MADPLLVARFWSKVEVGTPRACWNWRGSKVSGYGSFRSGNAIEKAHRVAWTLAYGEPPGDLHVLHRCDNPACVNPKHLFLGTNADNVADKVAKHRQARGIGHGVPGRRNPNAKLTPEQVLEAKTLLSAGTISQRKLAARFGVSQSALSLIVRGKNWARPEALST